MFDLQLHNPTSTVMAGFIPLVLRIPMETLPKSGIYGGEIEVDLNPNIPTGYVERVVRSLRPALMG